MDDEQPSSLPQLSLTGIDNTAAPPDALLRPSAETPTELDETSDENQDGGENAGTGCTRRFVKWRSGRDRWHNAEGSLINRGRQRLQALQSGPQTSPQLATIDEETNVWMGTEWLEESSS